jgi:hypothetical protein
MGEMRNAYNISVGKLVRKSTLGRSSHKRKDKVRMDLRVRGWEFVDWMHLAQVQIQ